MLTYPSAGSFSRDFHIRKILCAVRENPDISRTGLSEMEKISKPTTTRIVDQLLQEGLLVETGTIESRAPRRKPIGLRLNADRYCCVGVNITQNITSAVVTDFEAKPLYEIHGAAFMPATAEELYDMVEGLIRQVLAGAGKKETEVLGAGVGLPGLINAQNGIVVNYSTKGLLMDLPFREKLQQRFSFPILLDHDVNTLILSEKEFPEDVSPRNCLFLNYWGGIGSAVILNGKLLTGANHVVGEIGHTIVQSGGLKCRCGNFGCVEAYCLPETICAMVEQGLKRCRVSLLDSNEPPTIQAVLAAWEKGDGLCAEHVLATIRYLSICFANAINIFDPETVIFFGELFEYSEAFFQQVLEQTREKLLNTGAKDITFILRHSDSMNIRLGAVSLVFNDFFRRD